VVAAVFSLLPSPQFQARDAMVPSVSVLWSVKVQVSPEQLAVKLATGGVFVVDWAGIVTTCVALAFCPAPSVTVRTTV
jgi:hypothetical protein